MTTRLSKPFQVAIAKTVNPPKLLAELKAQNITGAIRKNSAASFTLLLSQQPSSSTDTQIQTVIAAHDPAPVVDPAITSLDNWAQLTASQKDALTLAALKKLYQSS